MRKIKIIKKGAIRPTLVTHEKKKFVPIEDIRKMWLSEHEAAKKEQSQQDAIIFEGGLGLNVGQN
jgi:hypothetical protein